MALLMFILLKNDMCVPSIHFALFTFYHFAIMFINSIDEIAITLPSCPSIHFAGKVMELMKLPAITLPSFFSLCLQSDGKMKK